MHKVCNLRHCSHNGRARAHCASMSHRVTTSICGAGVGAGAWSRCLVPHPASPTSAPPRILAAPQLARSGLRVVRSLPSDDSRNGAAGGSLSRAAWDRATDWMVACSVVPFSILVLPQVVQSALTLAGGNADALSIISWEVGEGRGGSTVFMMVHARMQTCTYLVVDGGISALTFCLCTDLFFWYRCICPHMVMSSRICRSVRRYENTDSGFRQARTHTHTHMQAGMRVDMYARTLHACSYRPTHAPPHRAT